MPELPEVELARRALERWLDRTEVVRAEAQPRARTFRGGKPKDFEALKGRLEKAERRGKYLMLTFSGQRGLMGHLGMSGKLVRRPKGVVEPFSRARLFLDSGEVIHLRDPRLFGQLIAVPADRLRELKPIKALGRDPLVDGLDATQLKAALGSSRQDLKVALMDQSRIAGLGNIHAAEALFRAKLHPARKPVTLTDAEWSALTRGIHAAIAFGLSEQGGEEIRYVEESGASNPFLIYGRAGAPCTVCGTTVRSFDQGGRTTHACPTCQPKGRAPPRARPKKKNQPRTATRRRR